MDSEVEMLCSQCVGYWHWSSYNIQIRWPSSCGCSAHAMDIVMNLWMFMLAIILEFPFIRNIIIKNPRDHAKGWYWEQVQSLNLKCIPAAFYYWVVIQYAFLYTLLIVLISFFSLRVDNNKRNEISQESRPGIF